MFIGSMSTVVEHLVNQVERCWELELPMPETISVPLGPDQNVTDLCLEWDAWCDGNSVSYSVAVIESDALTIIRVTGTSDEP